MGELPLPSRPVLQWIKKNSPNTINSTEFPVCPAHGKSDVTIVVTVNQHQQLMNSKFSRDKVRLFLYYFSTTLQFLDFFSV